MLGPKESVQGAWGGILKWAVSAPPPSCFSTGGVSEDINHQLNGMWSHLEEGPLGMPGRGVVILWVEPPPDWDPDLCKWGA